MNTRYCCLLALGLVVSCGEEDGAGSLAGGGAGNAGGTGGSDAGTGGTTSSSAESLSLYALPDTPTDLKETSFFDHPWPSDFRVDAEGKIVLEGYPNPNSNGLVAKYLTTMAGVIQGFSPAAGGFVRFTAPLDSSSFPATPLEALEATSSVQLIDVDPNSSELGERKRIRKVSTHLRQPWSDISEHSRARYG